VRLSRFPEPEYIDGGGSTALTSGESPSSPAQSGANRRRYPRCKIAVPMELHPEGSTAPFRTSTVELSVGGCYIETMFTFAVGTVLTMKLWIDEVQISTTAKVATCFPQVGNGMEFTEISAEDKTKIEQFLARHESADSGGN